MERKFYKNFKLKIINLGNFEAELEEIVLPNFTYVVEIELENDQTIQIHINGVKGPHIRMISLFIPTTELFIGGLPPGIIPHSKFNITTPLNGCISKVSQSNVQTNF